MLSRTWRSLACAAVVVLFDTQSALADRLIARDGAITVTTHEAEGAWCADTARLNINSGDRSVFSGNDPRLGHLAAVMQGALSFECPNARAVDVYGMVGSDIAYRGYATAVEGWRLHTSGQTLDADQIGVPEHWEGVVSILDETVTRQGIARQTNSAHAAFYPQPDGRVRARFDNCEGQLVVLRNGEVLADVPQVGAQERLFRIVPARRPFQSHLTFVVLVRAAMTRPHGSWCGPTSITGCTCGLPRVLRARAAVNRCILNMAKVTLRPSCRRVREASARLNSEPTSTMSPTARWRCSAS